MSISDIASLLFSSSRSIVSSAGTKIIPDLAIRERHHDELEITANPVQKGAAITDHAIINPARFTLEFGWTNSSLAALGSDFSNFSASDILTGNLGEGYITQVYQKLIALQRSRQLCTVVTGKRKYNNVLLESIDTYSDSSTAYSMICSINCRELQIVSVGTTTVATTNDVQANPASTSSETSTGSRQLSTSTNQSALSSLYSSITGG